MRKPLRLSGWLSVLHGVLRQRQRFFGTSKKSNIKTKPSTPSDAEKKETNLQTQCHRDRPAAIATTCGDDEKASVDTRATEGPAEFHSGKQPPQAGHEAAVHEADQAHDGEDDFFLLLVQRKENPEQMTIATR